MTVNLRRMDIDQYSAHVDDFGEWCRERDLSARAGILLAITHFRSGIELAGGVDDQARVLAGFVDRELSPSKRPQQPAAILKLLGNGPLGGVPLGDGRRRRGSTYSAEVGERVEQAIKLLASGHRVGLVAKAVGFTGQAMNHAFKVRGLGKPNSHRQRPADSSSITGHRRVTP